MTDPPFGGVNAAASSLRTRRTKQSGEQNAVPDCFAALLLAMTASVTYSLTPPIATPEMMNRDMKM
ncbi:MAG: hypothetical protein LBT00_04160 [Spirochaetaceae bacterium]|nr:hypothetical protein [Spirochaetaceae bacterium]